MRWTLTRGGTSVGSGCSPSLSLVLTCLYMIVMYRDKVCMLCMDSTEHFIGIHVLNMSTIIIVIMICHVLDTGSGHRNIM